MIELFLSLPDSRLSLNYHPTTVKKKIELKHINQAYREYAYQRTIEFLQEGAHDFTKNDRLEIHYVFSMPTKRKYDLDNIIMKPAQDGIFKALGLDDGIIDSYTKKRGEVNKTMPNVKILIKRI